MAQGFKEIIDMQEVPADLDNYVIGPFFNMEKHEADNAQGSTKSAYNMEMITSGNMVPEEFDNSTMETLIPFCSKLCGRAIEKTCRNYSALVLCPTQIQAPGMVIGYEDRPTMCSSDAVDKATLYIHDNHPPRFVEAYSNCCEWVTPLSPKCWNESDNCLLDDQMLGKPLDDFEPESTGLNDRTTFSQEPSENIVNEWSGSESLEPPGFSTEMTWLKSNDDMNENAEHEYPVDITLTSPNDAPQNTDSSIQFSTDLEELWDRIFNGIHSFDTEPTDMKSTNVLCENPNPENPVDPSLITPNDVAPDLDSQVSPLTKQEYGNMDSSDKIPPRQVVPQIWNEPEHRSITLPDHIPNDAAQDFDPKVLALIEEEYGDSFVVYLDYPNNIPSRPEPRWFTLLDQITFGWFSVHNAAFFQNFEEIPDTIEADASNRDFSGFWREFGASVSIYTCQRGMGSLWRDMKHKVKHYAMFKGRNKRKKTSSGITNNLKRTKEKTRGVIHEMFSMFQEGPAEIMLMQPPENNRGRSRSNGYKRQPRDVEADGIISDLASDPPGQQSVYIPPGDNRRESYRLSTFEQFPSRATIAANVAKHGFVYTGFYDRVKCFSCGRTVEKWDPTDNPADRKWHKPECPFVRGIPTGNIPIGSFFTQSFTNNFLSSNTQQPMEVAPSYISQIMNGPVMRIPTDVPGTASTFQIQPGSSVVIGSSQNLPPSRPPVTSHAANTPASAARRGWRMANVISADHKRHLTNLYLNRELDRLASFGRWPTGRRNVSPVALARAGFFYLGDMDRTQCFSCGGVLRNWSYEDDAMEEHRTHFANCRFVVGTERRNVPIPDRPETPQQLADKFPCRFPMNPHMRSEASRVDTFDRRWPTSRIRAKPHEIAEAGFFFLGERDRVKCWYCNGGLQNWEYDDIPWIEHSKWFPNCQFLLQKQGQLFVYRYLSLNPHLPRPIIGRQDGSTIDPVVTPPVGQSARVQDIPPSEPRARAPSPPPAIIDPQEEIRKRQERVEREMQNSETVKFVLLMGYAADTVRRVLKEKLESGSPFDADNIFEGTAVLLNAVMKMEEEIEKEKQEEQATNIKFPTVSQSHGASAMESMETAPSMGHTSGVFEVSGFSHDSDDEERDLYGSISENPTNRLSAGAVGVSTNGPISGGFRGALANGPMSLGTETRSSLLGAPEDTEFLKEFIEQKKEERLCKICFTENADMVFIPCSHMVCCKTCTEAIRQCPVCRTKIEKAIKTYVK